MKDAQGLNTAKTSKDVEKLDLDPVSRTTNAFAVKLADNQETSLKDLTREIGSTKTTSATALCWFLHWGSYSGLILDNALSTVSNLPISSRCFSWVTSVLSSW